MPKRQASEKGKAQFWTDAAAFFGYSPPDDYIANAADILKTYTHRGG